MDPSILPCMIFAIIGTIVAMTTVTKERGEEYARYHGNAPVYHDPRHNTIQPYHYRPGTHNTLPYYYNSSTNHTLTYVYNAGTNTTHPYAYNPVTNDTQPYVYNPNPNTTVPYVYDPATNATYSPPPAYSSVIFDNYRNNNESEVTNHTLYSTKMYGNSTKFNVTVNATMAVTIQDGSRWAAPLGQLFVDVGVEFNFQNGPTV
ncbi:unnamed protein product [Orchesella dallaii]|uniref:Uncharacterized protein n=1 Tax=Orchesella dallaii TaxID=48710 RepID=A0ABP1RGS7_9HEXA